MTEELPDLGILEGMVGPSWLKIAAKDLTTYDVLEVPGPQDHPRIIEYHRHTSYRAQHDEVPWCASAVCCWLEEAGYTSPRSAAARSFENFGVELEAPKLGCIAVYWRGPLLAAGLGHVGLWLCRSGLDDDLILGGNQRDSVCLRTYSRDRLLVWRWPIKRLGA